MNQESYNVSSLFVSIGLDTKPAENALARFENMLDGSVNRLMFTFTEQITNSVSNSFSNFGQKLGKDIIGGNITKAVEGAIAKFKNLEGTTKASLDGLKKLGTDAVQEFERNSRQTIGFFQTTVKDLENRNKSALESQNRIAKSQISRIALDLGQTLIGMQSQGGQPSQQQKKLENFISQVRNSATILETLSFQQIDREIQKLQQGALLLGANGRVAADSFKQMREGIVATGIELEKVVENNLKNLQLTNDIAVKGLEESGVKFGQQITNAYKEATKILTIEGVKGTSQAMDIMAKGVEKSIKAYEAQVETVVTRLAEQAQRLREAGNTQATAEADRLFNLANSIREQSFQVVQQVRESAVKASAEIEKQFSKSGGNASGGMMTGILGGISGALGGLGKGVLGVVGTAIAGILAEAIGNSIMFALNSRLELIKGTIGGFMSTIVKGMMNFGEEERRLNMATFVAGRKAGFGQDSPEFRQNYKGAEKAVTIAATDFSYGRVETAELLQQMVKAGFDLRDIVGGSTKEEIRRGVLYQGMGLGEAMGLPGDQLEEVAILLKQILSAFPGTSPKTAVRELAALGLSTPAEFQRFKFATQDSLSAAATAGIPLRDVMQGYATMFNMTTPEVAGTLLKNLYNGLNNPNQINRQLYGVFSKYFEGDLMGSLREPGDFNSKLAYLDTVADTIIKRGEAKQIPGIGDINAKYYETLNLQGQANLRGQLVSSLMGGGDTFTVAYRNLTLQGREALEKQKQEFENFNKNNPDGTGLMDDFIKLRQQGLKGAMDLVESSIENITTLFGSKLAPGFTQFVLFIKNTADELTASVEKFSGPIERLSERIGKAFGNLGDNKLLDQFVEGLIQTAGNLGSMLENLVGRGLTFIETGDNLTNMFKNLNDLLADFVGLMEGLFQVMQSFLPLLRESQGGFKTLGVDSEVRTEAEALKTRGEIGAVSDRVFNYGVETGKVGSLTITDNSSIVNLTAEEAKAVEQALQNTPLEKFGIKTGREKLVENNLGIFGGDQLTTRAETFNDVKDMSTGDRQSLIQQGFRKVKGEDGTDYFISGGTGKDQSRAFKIVDGKLVPINTNATGDDKGAEDVRSLGAALAPRDQAKPRVDPTVAGLGSFLTERQLEELKTNYPDLEERKSAVNVEQDVRVRQLFGSRPNAEGRIVSFNENTATVENINKQELTAEALSKNTDRLDALIRTASGKEGAGAAQALADTAKENPEIANLQALVNLSTGAVKGTKGEAPLLTQSQVVATLSRVEKGENIASVANEYTELTIKELEEAAKQKGKLKPAWERIKKQIESGEMVGDFTTFLEQFVNRQMEVVNNKNVPEAQRQAINENLREITKNSQVDQPRKIDKENAVAEGLTIDLDKYRKLLDDIHRTRIEQENAILQLRQKNVELERQGLVLATAYKGQINTSLESFLGMLSSSENSLLANRQRLQGIDQFFVDNKNNLSTRYKDVNPQLGGGIVENFQGTGQPVFVPKGSPNAEVNQFSKEIVQQQLDAINAKNQEANEILKQNKLIQENLALQIRNSIATGFQQAMGTISNLGGTLGTNTPIMNQANQMFDAVRQQGIQLSQQIQTLNVIRTMRPEDFTKEDARTLQGLQEIFKDIPNLLKEALTDLVNSMVRELNSFFNDLSERSKQRTEEVIGMLGIGGSVTKLLSIVNDVSSSLFRNQEEQLRIQQETSGVRRQVGLNRALGQFFPDEFFNQKVQFGEASIRINEAKIEGLKLDAQNILDMSRIKANLTYFESFLEIFRETRELGRGFSQIADDIIDFEKRQETYNKTVDDLELRIKLMTNQLETVTEVFGELSLVSKENLEQSKLYLEQQKKAVEAMMEIERQYRLNQAQEDLKSTLGNNENDFNQAQIEANNARMEILRLGKGRNARRGVAELELKNAQIEYERTIRSAINAASAQRLGFQRAQSQLEQRAASGAFTSDEAKLEASTRYAEIQAKIVGIDTELANTKNAAYNKLKVAMEKAATELDDLYRIKSQIADVVDGAFTSLYDILTDSSKSFEQKMKAFSENLLKELGRVGWNYLKDVLLAPLMDGLTKRDVEGIKDPVKPDYSGIKQLTFGDAAMENPDNQLNRMKTFEEILALDSKQQEQLKEVNARMRTSILEGINLDDAGKTAEDMYKTFSEQIQMNVGEGDLAKLIAMNSANGEQGMAMNIGLQTSMQERMKNTLLSVQMILGDTQEITKEIAQSLRQANKDKDKDKKPSDKDKTPADKTPTKDKQEIITKNEGQMPSTGQQPCIPVCDGHGGGGVPTPAQPTAPTGETPATPVPVQQPTLNTPVQHTVKEQLDMYPENHEFRNLLRQQRQQEHQQMMEEINRVGGRYLNPINEDIKSQLNNEVLVASSLSDMGMDLGLNSQMVNKSDFGYRGMMSNDLNTNFKLPFSDNVSAPIRGNWANQILAQAEGFVPFERGSHGYEMMINKAEVLKIADDRLPFFGHSEVKMRNFYDSLEKSASKATPKGGGGGGFFGQLLGGFGGIEGLLGMVLTSLPLLMQLFMGDQKPKRYNSGGIVEGAGNTDTIPAMLTPGEGVLTHKGMSYLGGENVLNALNSGNLQIANIQPPQNLGMDMVPSSDKFMSQSALPTPSKSNTEKTISEFMGDDGISLPKIELNYASTNFNGQNFVTEEVFKQALEQTVETAKNAVYDSIRYSPSARRKLGIN